ncbi:MAG TPA: hypothetical protein VN455_06530 [Methanotrichaceae archaeon]|nr:hypothetical protein [Methanotrichaceae archaeon]
MEKVGRFDVWAEMAYIDFELEALLESHPEIAQGHEKDLEDLGLDIYLRRQPTDKGW